MNRRDIYNRFDGHCAYCGKKIEFDDMTIDHILPQSKGGKDTEENNVPACQPVAPIVRKVRVRKLSHDFGLHAPSFAELKE